MFASEEAPMHFICVWASWTREKSDNWVFVCLLIFRCWGSNPDASHIISKCSATKSAFTKNFLQPVVVTHTCNPSTWRAEAGASPLAWGRSIAQSIEWDLAPKAQNSFLLIGPISQDIRCAISAVCCREIECQELLGQWEPKWWRGDTCNTVRPSMGQSWETREIICCFHLSLPFLKELPCISLLHCDLTSRLISWVWWLRPVILLLARQT